MASGGYLQAAVLLLAAQLLCLGAADADQETGTVIPAESRCIYMQDIPPLSVQCRVWIVFRCN